MIKYNYDRRKKILIFIMSLISGVESNINRYCLQCYSYLSMLGETCMRGILINSVL